MVRAPVKVVSRHPSKAAVRDGRHSGSKAAVPDARCSGSKAAAPAGRRSGWTVVGPGATSVAGNRNGSVAASSRHRANTHHHRHGRNCRPRGTCRHHRGLRRHRGNPARRHRAWSGSEARRARTVRRILRICCAWPHSPPFTRRISIFPMPGRGSPSTVRLPDSQVNMSSETRVIVWSAAVRLPSAA